MADECSCKVKGPKLKILLIATLILCTTVAKAQSGMRSEWAIARPGVDLQKAVDRAAKGSGRLFISQGKYFINRPLRIKRGMIIEGAARELTQIFPSRTFSGDALVEVVAYKDSPFAADRQTNIRGLRFANMTLAHTGSGPGVRPLNAGLLIGRDGASECRDNVFEHLYIVGHFKHACAVLGMELSSIRDCEFISWLPGGIGIYVSSKNHKAFRASGRLITSNTTTYNVVNRCTFGTASPPKSGGVPDGVGIMLDDLVAHWIFQQCFLTTSSSRKRPVQDQPSSLDGASLIRLHQRPGKFATQPRFITFQQCGNDQPRARHGLHITSDQFTGPDAPNAAVGAFNVVLDQCHFIVTSTGILAEADVLDLSVRNCTLLWGTWSLAKDEAHPIWFKRHLRGSSIEFLSTGMQRLAANTGKVRRKALIRVDGKAESCELSGLQVTPED